jgi:hypothetical protein
MTTYPSFALIASAPGPVEVPAVSLTEAEL